MEAIQGYMLQSLRNVQGFINHHAALLGDVAHSGARRRLDAVLADLAAHVTDQEARRIAAQGQTRELDALRRSLRRDHLLPIVRIARASVEQVEELASLHLPDKRLPAERLAGEARAVADAALRNADVFIAAGMPENFGDQLHVAVDAFQSAVGLRASFVGQRAGATHGLAQSLAEGRRIVNVLDAFIRRAVWDDPVLLAEWKQVKRVAP